MGWGWGRGWNGCTTAKNANKCEHLWHTIANIISFHWTNWRRGLAMCTRVCEIHHSSRTFTWFQEGLPSPWLSKNCNHLICINMFQNLSRDYCQCTNVLHQIRSVGRSHELLGCPGKLRLFFYFPWMGFFCSSSSNSLCSKHLISKTLKSVSPFIWNRRITFFTAYYI